MKITTVAIFIGVWASLAPFFISTGQVEKNGAVKILDEYKKEILKKKETDRKQKVIESMIFQYGEKHKEVKKYVAERLLDELGEKDAKVALAVIKNESGFNPKRVSDVPNKNGTIDKGLWQINDIHNLSDEVRLDYKKSTEWAINKIKRDKGFWAWSAYKNHVYGKEHLYGI